MSRALLLAAALLAAAAPSRAQDATLTRIAGLVYVRPGGAAGYFQAKGGEELLYGDSVKTGPGAVAQLVIGARGAVLIRENTTFALEGDPQNTLLNFTLGEFLIGLRHKLERGQRFRVRTPAAVAAVRGTLFWGKTRDDKSTTYAGFGSTIAVTAQGKTVLVRAGETTNIPFGGAPAAATKHSIPVSYLDHFKISGELQGLEALIDLPGGPVQ